MDAEDASDEFGGTQRATTNHAGKTNKKTGKSGRPGKAGGVGGPTGTYQRSDTKRVASQARVPTRATRVTRVQRGAVTNAGRNKSSLDRRSPSAMSRPAAVMAEHDYGDDDSDDDEFAAAARAAQEQRAAMLSGRGGSSSSGGGGGGAHGDARGGGGGGGDLDPRAQRLIDELAELDQALAEAREHEVASVHAIARERERGDHGAARAAAPAPPPPTQQSPSGRGRSSGGGEGTMASLLWGGDDEEEEQGHHHAGARGGGSNYASPHGTRGRGNIQRQEGLNSALPGSAMTGGVERGKYGTAYAESDFGRDTESDLSVARARNMGHRNIFEADERKDHREPHMATSRRHDKSSYHSNIDLAAGDEMGVDVPLVAAVSEMGSEASMLRGGYHPYAALRNRSTLRVVDATSEEMRGERAMEEAAWRESARQKTLVLDVRSVEDFNEGRIFGAMHFDIGRIHRAEPFNAFMYGFKDDPTRRVVVYDLTGEGDSLEIANEMSLRGFESIFILVGGFARFGQECGQFIKGKMPPAPAPEPEEDMISLYTTVSSTPQKAYSSSVGQRKR